MFKILKTTSKMVAGANWRIWNIYETGMVVLIKQSIFKKDLDVYNQNNLYALRMSELKNLIESKSIEAFI